MQELERVVTVSYLKEALKAKAEEGHTERERGETRGDLILGATTPRNVL